MITPKSYTHRERSLVWSMATIVPGVDWNIRRKDACGAWIDWAAFGDRNSIVGWEIDHKIPLSKGGAHHINNVQSLHWQNNAIKGDGPLVCAVTATRG